MFFGNQVKNLRFYKYFYKYNVWNSFFGGLRKAPSSLYVYGTLCETFYYIILGAYMYITILASATEASSEGYRGIICPTKPFADASVRYEVLITADH